MRWILVALLMSCALVAQAEEVWRWVDENGVVHFSDRPRPGAERVELNRPQTYTPPPLPARQETASPAPSEPDAAPAYTGVRVVSPAAGETLWNIAGELTVQVEVQPGLAPGHQLRVSLDGQRVETPPGATQFTVSPVFRGEHRLSVAVVDENGRELVSSEPVTFYVHQASLQNPNRPR
ncbi:DUF4124 domain-containing protein [Thioalkalivibrio sp. XN279]|uniref:DUF4124 domain-containing protein n=1 Tax=Thioalkalivibrio sp. XN279 TaxID=2714953 RepID=UPI001F1090E1|nr:DUF4124 domain-containing protein [Thioalkalivibrio sp. XN279]